MVRPITNHITENFSLLPLALGLFVSVSLLITLCAKHARHVPRKYSSKTSETNTPYKAPVPSPKQLITTTSHKDMMPAKKTRQETDIGIDGNIEGREESGLLWQKAVLMGERCRPPKFSGVIFYDCAGNRIPEMPRSPRATPMSPLRNFVFHLEKTDKSVC